MRPLASAVVPVAVLVSLLPAVASATAPGTEDWRATACMDDDLSEGASLSGPYTVTILEAAPVTEVEGLQVRLDRLAFSNGTCELLYAAGPLPRGSAVRAVRNQLCTSVGVALDGVDKGATESCAALGGPVAMHDSPQRLDLPRNLTLFAVAVYRAQESEVLEAEPGMPSDMVGATYTTTYAGSTWSIVLRGTTLVKRSFDRTSATNRAAQAAYATRIDRAERRYARQVAEIEASSRSAGWKERQLDAAATERREAVLLARRQLRLALDGVRLINKEFHARYSGSVD